MGADLEATGFRRLAVRVGVLGPLRLDAGADRLDAGPPLRRKVLAILVCAGGEVVSTGRLIDCVWDDGAARSALSSLHVHISRLRTTLGRETIVHHSYGYALTVGSDEVDAVTFVKLAHRGRRRVECGDVRGGREQLREALALWRGHAYEEFDDCCWARLEIVRLHAERLSALVARIDTDLEIGDTDVVGELEALVLQHPRHEGLCARLMVTLYRTGRQADALAVYREHARRLVETSGLRPAPALQELELRILHHDPDLDKFPAPFRVGAAVHQT